MAQFDVHRNPGRNRESTPYVVVLQSSAFDDYKRRVVAPLVRKAAIGRIDHARFNPTFVVAGKQVVLHPLDIASVPLNVLGKPVASLASEGRRIIDACDELISTVYG